MRFLRHALHIFFHCPQLEDAEAIVVQTLGVKQGDVLGPQLYLFHGIGLMMAWRARCGKGGWANTGGRRAAGGRNGPSNG